MYQPPIKDYEFLLRDVFDGQTTLGLAQGGELALDDAMDVLGYAGTLAAELIVPLDATGDRAGSTLMDGDVSSPSGFADAYKVFAENGWVGLSASEQYGGGGMPLSIANAANEFFSAANAAFHRTTPGRRHLGRHGGMGFIEETGVAQHYRDARITPIYEGTTAAHANDLVGRKLLRDRGSLAGEALDLIVQSAALLPADEPVAQRLASRLDTAVQHARRSTEAIIEQGNSRDALAVAVPYLMQLGTVAGGWMHARLLTAALANPDAVGAEAQQRVLDADFYGAHQLSKTPSFTEVVQAGEIAIGLVPAT